MISVQVRLDLFTNFNIAKMSTQKTLIGGRLLAIVAAGLVLSSCGSAINGDKDTVPAMVQCGGVNQCKGLTSCKSTNNSCRGQNSCKSQGWLSMSRPECDAQGGTSL